MHPYPLIPSPRVCIPILLIPFPFIPFLGDKDGKSERDASRVFLAMYTITLKVAIRWSCISFESLVETKWQIMTIFNMLLKKSPKLEFKLCFMCFFIMDFCQRSEILEGFMTKKVQIIISIRYQKLIIVYLIKINFQMPNSSLKWLHVIIPYFRFKPKYGN